MGAAGWKNLSGERRESLLLRTNERQRQRTERLTLYVALSDGDHGDGFGKSWMMKDGRTADNQWCLTTHKKWKWQVYKSVLSSNNKAKKKKVRGHTWLSMLLLSPSCSSSVREARDPLSRLSTCELLPAATTSWSLMLAHCVWSCTTSVPTSRLSRLWLDERRNEVGPCFLTQVAHCFLLVMCTAPPLITQYCSIKPVLCSVSVSS